MPEVQKYSLVDELIKADSKFMNSPALLGSTMLTYPCGVNAMRSTMFTSHLKQFLNLINPDFPLLFTGTENLVGKYSDGYEKAKHKLRVIKKVAKYEDILEHPNIYQMFVFDEVTKTYDVIERTPEESLTENFGYLLNNEVIDSLKEDDIINEDTVLYRSYSYDENMNYRYGKNVNVAYTLDPYTSEDAAVASKSLCEKFVNIETEDITIGLNQNDFLINIYGDEKHYKPLPDIGEITSDRLCVVRRQFNNQLLFDFKESSLCEAHEGDLIYFVDKDVEIVDYTIYSNQEEIVDNPFSAQINKYLRSQNIYWRKIFKETDKILKSGFGYTRDIEYLWKRSQEFLDNTNKKWTDGDHEFGNMVLVVSFKRYAPLAKGSKLTGRFGNKSVVAEIREDEDMPFTVYENGEVVRADLLINLLAIINRTTAEVLVELFVTGASKKLCIRLSMLETLKEQEDLLFDFIGTFNTREEMKLREYYKNLKTKKRKEEFMKHTIESLVYINQLPIAEDEPMFYKCKRAMEKFDFLVEDFVYINKWGQTFKTLSKTWFGKMYILKQNLGIQNPSNCWELLRA